MNDVTCYLDEKSQLQQPLPAHISNNDLLAMYRLMSLTRAMDNKAINLQRTGKMGTYPAARGQEAVGVGIGYAMQSTDVLCPYYRDQGAMIQRGISMTEIFQYWGGFEQGSCYANNQHDLPICVPIATQCLHAAGVAYAMHYRQQQNAVVTTCGEGATSKGDFYEALNAAGVWQLPVVFVINNNQWAISVPRKIQTHSASIAQKAVAAGIEYEQIDGFDVITVETHVAAALEKARSGKGPTVIEAISYRLCDHTTADDATRYQPTEEVKRQWKKEPIARLAYYLEAQSLWSKEQEKTLQEEITAEVNQAAKEYLATPTPHPREMFSHLHAELPDSFIDQLDLINE